MKPLALRHSPWLLLALSSAGFNAQAYESSYDTIQWDKRGNDTFYCIDITDENFQVHPWLQALSCGENFYNFSPKTYLSQVMKRGDLMPGTRFGWRVWSPGGYGGAGYEGVVTVQSCAGQPYASSSSSLQWSCRNNDSFYCVDILNAQGGMVKQAAACNEGLHSFSPATLNLSAGDYQWKVWSPSGYGNSGFEGQFSVAGSTTPVVTTPDPVVTTPVVTTPVVTTPDPVVTPPVVTTPVVTTPVVTTPTPAENGKTLFSQNCKGCHGTPGSIGAAANPATTRAAINANKGGMGFLKTMTDAELSDIAAYVQNPF